MNIMIVEEVIFVLLCIVRMLLVVDIPVIVNKNVLLNTVDEGQLGTSVLYRSTNLTITVWIR